GSCERNERQPRNVPLALRAARRVPHRRAPRLAASLAGTFRHAGCRRGTSIEWRAAMNNLSKPIVARFVFGLGRAVAGCASVGIGVTPVSEIRRSPASFEG